MFYIYIIWISNIPYTTALVSHNPFIKLQAGPLRERNAKVTKDDAMHLAEYEKGLVAIKLFLHTAAFHGLQKKSGIPLAFFICKHTLSFLIKSCIGYR
jgi:hypothetical protein